MRCSKSINRLGRKIILATVGTGVVASTLLLAMGTASAGTSGTHNNYYSYAGLYAGNLGTGGVIANEYNDQSVTMQCYSDGANVTDRNFSNYNSPRWFRIRDAGGRIGYIHSSYVYNQTSVGRC